MFPTAPQILVELVILLLHLLLQLASASKNRALLSLQCRPWQHRSQSAWLPLRSRVFSKRNLLLLLLLLQPQRLLLVLTSKQRAKQEARFREVLLSKRNKSLNVSPGGERSSKRTWLARTLRRRQRWRSSRPRPRRSSRTGTRITKRRWRELKKRTGSPNRLFLRM